MNVLVVDPEAKTRELLRVYLEDNGHRVILAYTMAKVLRTVRYESIDVLIVDLLCGDGEKTALEMMAHAIRHQIPVVAMAKDWAGFPDFRDTVHCVLTKPLSEGELATLKTAFEKLEKK